VQTIIGILSFVIGVVSVIMIIVGGIKYVLSNGDASQVTSAKNTILYAVIGLVVALLAYAIVNFVVTQFTK
jgi:multisubunit Na+/H+ antiporter MnhB subunit